MDDRPLCKCHGKPMWRNPDPKMTVGFSWRCAVKASKGNAERQRRLRERRRLDGQCVRCGADDPISVVCWDCLNQMEERHALSF